MKIGEFVVWRPDSINAREARRTGMGLHNRVHYRALEPTPWRGIACNFTLDKGNFVALKAKVFKLQLNVSDMNRHHYQDYALTLARHPSETDERMMVRVLAFALNAHDDLQFCKGLSTDDEPDLWQKDLTGHIVNWLDVGQPSDERIRKACTRSDRVSVYAYASEKVQQSWQADLAALAARFSHLQLFGLAGTDALASLVAPQMQLQCTIDGDEIWLSDGEQHPVIRLTAFQTQED